MNIEEIEKRWRPSSIVTLSSIVNNSLTDVDWLIRRVKELENTVKFLEARNKDLTENVKRLRQGIVLWIAGTDDNDPWDDVNYFKKLIEK